ncbi:MAG: hypothetical protein EXX96DRAFT_543325 [Benjaminiella poitrasii]|nr:MAG: hypothetical protein EXX96DRAFT_543325 [Benjaminiella poitrasii]
MNSITTLCYSYFKPTIRALHSPGLPNNFDGPSSTLVDDLFLAIFTTSRLRIEQYSGLFISHTLYEMRSTGLFIVKCLAYRLWDMYSDCLCQRLDALFITVNISDIIQSCTHLDFNSRLLYCKFSGILSPTIIVLTSIVEIWKAHYQFVFNSIPFDPHAVLQHIRQHLAT